MKAFLAVARAAAEAGAAQLAQRPDTLTPLGLDDLGAMTKSSGSDWVTDFDRRAEDAIRFVLQSYRPHDEIYGEEYGATTVAEPSGYRWSIDPLDGTTNFIRGLPHYCSSVAVQYQGRWVAAAIVAPALGRSWWATAGGGAFTSQTGRLEVGLHRPSRAGAAERSSLGTFWPTVGIWFCLRPRSSWLPIRTTAATADRRKFSDIRRTGSAALRFMYGRRWHTGCLRRVRAASTTGPPALTPKKPACRTPSCMASLRHHCRLDSCRHLGHRPPRT